MRTLALASVVGLSCGLIFTAAAFAGPITLTVGPTGNYPPNARPVNVTIGTYTVAPVLVAPRTSASTKASLIYGALVGLPAIPGFPYANMTVSYTTPNNFVTIGGLPKGTVVKFSPGQTGDEQTS